VAEHASGQLLLGAIGANGFISFDTGGKYWLQMRE